MAIPEQPFGFVAGRWVLSLADTPMDSDRAPDYKPLYPGSVIFNNKLSHRVVTDGSETVGIVKTRYEANLNEEGRIIDAEEHEFVALPVGVYSVTFSFGQYSWPNFDIEVKPEHTLDSPLWLPSKSPVPTGPGVVHVVSEEARLAAEAAAASAWEAVDTPGRQGPQGIQGPPGDANTVPGKNLYNPNTDTLDQYIHPLGHLITLAGYRTTDYISVTPGLPYTVRNARFVAFWDDQKEYIPESRIEENPPVPGTYIPPEGAAYMRLSYFDSGNGPESQQIEQSATATAYEPWYRRLDPSIVVGETDSKPLMVTYDGNLIETQSMLGSDVLTVRFREEDQPNNVFNFSSVSLGPTTVATANDDITPIRTQQSTVGGNHGTPGAQRWLAGAHDKTDTDLGSTWTDGQDEYVLISINSEGAALFGRKYTISSNGEAVTSTAAPAGDLTHVSGATNTTTVSIAEQSGRTQLRPWVQRRRLVVLLDGQPLVAGETATGHELTVRESYEILDFRHIYDWATTHVGQHYTTVHHRAAVGVETNWTIRPGGKMRLKTALWEISPTLLGNSGFLQAGALIGSGNEGAVTRWLPGVGPIDGLNWDEGVDLALLATSQNVTVSDLIDPSTPPTTLVDARNDMAMAIAVSPWLGASERATRLASTPSNLWDLRSTRKVYPNVLNAIAPGWGRIEVEGIRAYLTLEEAQAVVTDADALSAWVTLDHIVG